ncbi:uncharacterized protein [Dendropsophus ebraccatus]|uniref:uncharacterized protein n=1 Tax=Dendropsophus ebraccatus TaxID=150705 RepID=UPI0038319E71
MTEKDGFTRNTYYVHTSPFFALVPHIQISKLTNIYKQKFPNFKNVIVTGFRQGSVVSETQLQFQNSTTPAPSYDNTVRALVSSLQGNSSMGILQVSADSIKSNGATLANLGPLNVSVNFLIKKPYNESTQQVLINQANSWVNSTLLMLPNVTTAANPTTTFTNVMGWTHASIVFPVTTVLWFDADTTLSNFIKSRQNVQFTIVPSSLKVQGKSLTFNTISPPLGILNNISPSQDLLTKSSAVFQDYSQRVENSFKDIFGQQLVEPVVTSFSFASLTVIVSIDLYFQSNATNQSAVIQQMITNEGTFRNRGLILDLLVLDPKVGVQVTFTLLQDYNSSLSDASSPDFIALQSKVLSLLTPALKDYYSNGLQDPPALSFKNVDGSAAMVIQYKLNYTMNVDSSSVLNSLLKNTGLTNITRIASWSVNGIKPFVDAFIIKPRFTNQVYTSDLKDRKSKTFRDLESNITQVLSSILQNVKQIVVLSFQEGSVISTVETSFTPGTTSYPQLSQMITNSRNLLANKNLDLDPQSLYTNPQIPVSSPSESSFPGYAVAIIVMCILLILAIPLVILLVLRTDLCQKLSNACSLKTPYERHHGGNFGSGLTNYKIHSYDLNR